MFDLLLYFKNSSLHFNCFVIIVAVGNLSEYLPWQTTLQPAYLSSKSPSSRLLVDTINFIELQSALPQDDNSYHMEMMKLHEKSNSPGKYNQITVNLREALGNKTLVLYKSPGVILGFSE